MTSAFLDDDIVNGVVQHMNEDHSDACLTIVQTLGGLPEASTAQMIGMDTMAIEFCAVMADNTSTSTRVMFDKPITDSRQIRGHLVSMAKRARKNTQSTG